MKKNFLLIGLLAFAVSCSSQPPKNNDNMKNDRLTYFHFGHHNTMVRFKGEDYKVATMKDGRIQIIIDESFPQEKEFYIEDATIFDELKAIVDEFKMHRYKKSYTPLMEITDGDSWSLYYKYESGESQSSGGYMAWPKNYREAHKAISDYFQKWRDYPVQAKEINLFHYTCRNNYGCDIEYRMERGEKEATLYMRNAEHPFEKTLSVSNDQLGKLQELVNTYRMKDEYSRTTDDDSASIYHFRVDYNTGDTIDFYGYHTTFIGGLEGAFRYFFDKWLPLRGKMVDIDYTWRSRSANVSYHIIQTDGKYTLYYYGPENKKGQYEIAAETVMKFQKLVESFGLDNAENERDGNETWALSALYDSEDRLSVGGQDTEQGESIFEAIKDFFAPYIK